MDVDKYLELQLNPGKVFSSSCKPQSCLWVDMQEFPGSFDGQGPGCEKAGVQQCPYVQQSGLWGNWLSSETDHRDITLIQLFDEASRVSNCCGTHTAEASKLVFERIPAVLFLDRCLTELILVPDIMSDMLPLTIPLCWITDICSVTACTHHLGDLVATLDETEKERAVVLHCKSAEGDDIHICFLEVSAKTKDLSVIALTSLCAQKSN